MRHLHIRRGAAAILLGIVGAATQALTPAQAQAPAQATSTVQSQSQANPSLLVNGDFTNGFTGWQLSASFTDVLSQPYDGFSGIGGATYALLGPVGADGSLTQTITDTPGAPLTLSFSLASDGGLANDFTAAFDATPLLALTNLPRQPWQTYTFTTTATGADALTFSFRDDPGYLALDQVSATQSVPEPSAVELYAFGISVVVAGRKLRKKVVLF
jgi:hypothetical protein